MSERERETHKDNDIAVCVYCGCVAKYADGTTKMIPLTTEELMKLSHDKETWSMLMKFKKVGDNIRNKIESKKETDFIFIPNKNA